MSHVSIKHHVKAIVFWLFKACCLAISLLYSSHQFTFISFVKQHKTTGHIWWVIRWFIILSTLTRESERKVSKLLKWWEEELQSLLAALGLSLSASGDVGEELYSCSYPTKPITYPWRNLVKRRMQYLWGSYSCSLEKVNEGEKNSLAIPLKALNPFCCCRKKPDTQLYAPACIPSAEDTQVTVSVRLRQA